MWGGLGFNRICMCHTTTVPCSCTNYPMTNSKNTMWGGLGFNRICMRHTTTVPCSCTNYPMTNSKNTMWGGLGFNRICMCDTTTVPCSCTNYPMTNSNNLYYQRAHENTIYDQEASEQMTANEIDSWLLSNPDNNPVDGSLNLQSYGSCSGTQYQGQFIQMQNHGLQTSLLPMVAGIAPEATFGTMDLPQEYWAPNQFSYSPFYSGNLIKEAVGAYSNSTSISSLGTQQLISPDDLQKSSDQYPPMTRQDRILRYFEKKKARKYEKKMIYSSRKTHAQTRPRIRGRFARRSQTDSNDKTVGEVLNKKTQA